MPVPRISFQPSGSLLGIIGEMQDIICSVTITAAIEPDLVELTWTNNDSIITTDNRVTITPTNITENPSSFTYTTTIRFAYLMEGDEGNYTCNVAIDDMMESRSVKLQNLRGMYINACNTSTASFHIYQKTSGIFYKQRTCRSLSIPADLMHFHKATF